MMGRKGIFSGAIAVFAIAIIAGFAFSSMGVMDSRALGTGAENVSDFKREVQNIEFVLGKSASDAIADSVYEQGCSFVIPNVQAKANAYFSQTLSGLGSGFPACSVSNVSVNGSAANATISLVLDCQKTFSGTDISYRKILQYNKNTSTPGPTPPATCRVVVTDPDFGVEVDQSK